MSDAHGRLSRRGVISMAAGAGLARLAAGAAIEPRVPQRKPGQKTALGLAHAPLAVVRVGMIGMGNRGSALLGNLLDIEKVRIAAVCDVIAERAERACARVADRSGRRPATYSAGENDFENLCRRDDIDAVYIATPWQWHAPMAVCAMNNGKHAFVEVPAATTIEECWELVDTAEQTQRHCMMLENCCYGETEMMVLNMVRAGVFGEILHGEAGYLHPLAQYMIAKEPSAAWRRRFHSLYNGNLYPTHGLGPVAQYMGINRDDRFDYLVSMSAPERTLSMLRDALPEDDPRRRERYACGDVNTTLIRTARGRTIMVQYDVCIPRPYSRINTICGTDGIFSDYPPRIHLRGMKRRRGDEWETDLSAYREKYGHELWRQIKEAALKSGGHGGMDYVMNWRLMQCLLEGKPLDMSVYDAAAWSSIMPLSVMSVAGGSTPVAVPDFTRGQVKPAGSAINPATARTG